MSIVAVHGPYTFGGTGAAGGGSGPVVQNAGGSVTANMSNGLQFSLLGAGDRAAADYDWTFSDGTAAINNNKGPVNVTFATPGAKTITLTVGSSAGTTPPATTYTYNVTADTAPTTQVVDNAGGTVTGDQLNGLLFNLAGKGDRAAADYDWKFGGTPADILNTKTTTVTFPTAGTKTITLSVGSSAGTTPPSQDYTFTVTATTGAMPRSMPPPPNGKPPPEGEFNPSEHTAAEVNAYADANQDDPDEIQRVLDLEVADKNRTTVVSHLEALLPYDPADYTVAEVVDYATANPDQLDDIIAAEQAGKNRTTLLNQLEALRP